MGTPKFGCYGNISTVILILNTGVIKKCTLIYYGLLYVDIYQYIRIIRKYFSRHTVHLFFKLYSDKHLCYLSGYINFPKRRSVAYS